MEKIHETDDLKIHLDRDSIEFSALRSANPKSVEFPPVKPPKALDILAAAKAGSGHDCFLKGIVVYVDWNINKIVREQLLRYSFINVISSQSLMHCFSKFKESGKISEDIRSVDEVPLSFKYFLSFQTNYLQLKTIYAQRKKHKREEWRTFCKALKDLPNSTWITQESEDV